MKSQITRSLALSTSSLALFLLASCTPYQQQGAAVGALGGAAVGAIAGNDGGDVVRGAAIGAAAGTGVTAYQEKQERDRNQSYNNTRSYTPAPTPPSHQAPATIPTTPTRQAPASGNYPLATAGITPNTAISPYPPYNVLNIEGYKSGQKVCDPSTIPIDPATGRQYVNPSTGLPDVKKGKYFLVP